MAYKMFVITFAILLGCTSGIEFDIQLENFSRTCFKQFITESTPYHFKATAADNPVYQFSLVFKDGTILMKNPSKNLVKKIDSYSAASQTYNFCIQNLSPKQKFHIEFLSGIQLSDSQFFPKQQDSKQINKLVDYLNTVYTQVKKKEEYSMTVNQYNMQLQKLVSFKSVGFGFLSITVVLIISFLHYMEIKRVLKNRKII